MNRFLIRKFHSRYYKLSALPCETNAKVALFAIDNMTIIIIPVIQMSHFTVHNEINKYPYKLYLLFVICESKMFS